MRGDVGVWTAPVVAEPHARPRRGVNARSLLRTVAGEYMMDGRWTWSQTIVGALGLFGFDDAAVRQALLRTAKEVWLERKRHGRRVAWRLSQSAQRIAADAHERVYRFESGRTDWNGQWLVLVVSTPDERTRLLLRRRLAWVGFGVLCSGHAMISPHVERELEAHRVLETLGLDRSAVSFLAVTGSYGFPKHVISAAWDLDDLHRRYQSFLRQLGGMQPRSDRDVFIAHTTLAHEWRRFPYFDPGLPIDYLPAGWPGREAKMLFDDRYARWRPRASRWFQQLDAT